ncbi:hypothetical protein CRE_01282 [Caenorhabditis remanei]|uniref:Uncharacterized protein n=1 Tax=Caenorhabditis remanei TaxID=31234 RepID=E3N9R6_CAERE|nr:hypothetical protein CRE_01282 [Caenorhabditis remanei]
MDQILEHTINQLRAELAAERVAHEETKLRLTTENHQLKTANQSLSKHCSKAFSELKKVGNQVKIMTENAKMVIFKSKSLKIKKLEEQTKRIERLERIMKRNGIRIPDDVDVEEDSEDIAHQEHLTEIDMVEAEIECLFDKLVTNYSENCRKKFSSEKSR